MFYWSWSEHCWVSVDLLWILNLLKLFLTEMISIHVALRLTSCCWLSGMFCTEENQDVFKTTTTTKRKERKEL